MSCTHVSLISTFLINTVLRLLVLLEALNAGPDGADFDFLQWGREVCVERERIHWVDVPSSWMLPEHLELCTRKRFQVALQFAIWNRRSVFDVLVCQVVSLSKILKEQQDDQCER